MLVDRTRTYFNSQVKQHNKRFCIYDKDEKTFHRWEPTLRCGLEKVPAPLTQTWYRGTKGCFTATLTGCMYSSNWCLTRNDGCLHWGWVKVQVQRLIFVISWLYTTHTHKAEIRHERFLLYAGLLPCIPVCMIWYNFLLDITQPKNQIPVNTSEYMIPM